MRAFVAIDVPDAVREALEAVQDELGVGRKMAPDTFHLTLAFLDDQPEHVLAALHEELGALRADPFPLTLRGLDTFGGRSPKLLWASAEPTPALSDLRNHVRAAAHRAGISLPRERFRPHVTLARFRQGLRCDEAAKIARFLSVHGDFGPQNFEVEHFALYQSTLHHDGALHDVLVEYPLCGA